MISSIFPVLEIIMATARLILVLIIIFMGIYLVTKTAGKLRRMLLWALASLVPTSLYTIGQMMSIELLFRGGKLVSMTLNLLTTTFWLFAVLSVNSLVQDITSLKKVQEPSTHKKRRKPIKRVIVFR